MADLTIHPCKCGTEPKLVYSHYYKQGMKPQIQVKCPKCGARNRSRSDSVQAILNWNARFEQEESNEIIDFIKQNIIDEQKYIKYPQRGSEKGN